MTSNVRIDKLQINQAIYDLVTNEILPGTGIEENKFWLGMQHILEQFAPVNKKLLAKRDNFQQQIDAWHLQHKNQDFNHEEYKQFLKDINYIVDEVPEFSISTENVDPEIATIAGPQLVVPINNARFSLNAANARWGSLFDAFYGTDVLPNEGTLAKGTKYNPKRGKKVVELTNDFLDKALPLTKGRHKDVSAYRLNNNSTENLTKAPTKTNCNKENPKNLHIYLNNGDLTELLNPSAFVGFTEHDVTSTLLFVNNGLHIEIKIDPTSIVSQSSSAGVKDVVIESALTAIQDCEDSVAAVDAEDKTLVYRNWLGLMQGNLEQKIEKDNQIFSRKLSPDRHYTRPTGESFTLSGRSLLLIRNVGHLMTTDCVLLNGEEAPEGIIDGLMTALIYIHDMKGNSPYKNSKCNSLYIVKPKMHGPEEVRFTIDLFTAIENVIGMPKNTMKVGIMDEERRTTVNLKACIYEARERLIFINTGFLDRTGDEIHTSMEAGSFLPKAELKDQPWISAYEDWNVDIGLESGLSGKAQIGKGMWAMPDLMADMIKQKIQHPLAGANCAWVPSPTAATLHAMHYHTVSVTKVQKKLAARQRANLDDILTIPLTPSSYVLSREKLLQELDDNAQSILGYVVRWIDQGIGCSKVPDTRHIELMEDRATLRISSQIIANWLYQGLCSEEQVTHAFKKMAVLVDEQNKHDPFYTPMASDFNGIAFRAALDLAIKGAEQPNGYTEPLLHHYRKIKKSS